MDELKEGFGKKPAPADGPPAEGAPAEGTPLEDEGAENHLNKILAYG